ncbi:hypothetical protein JR338_05750 [Chloroflexota bacterium]|nr:hypothetical protein JR338_05750 [Chloroflexota bacterium]
MHNRMPRVWVDLFIILILLVSLACSLPSVLTSRSQTIHHISPTSEPTAQWTIGKCDAIENVAITLSDFEEVVYNEDGNINCNYTHEILNPGSQPIRVFYYKQWYYGEIEPPNDTAFGWNKIRAIQPGESWPLSSSFSYCAECTPPQYESFTFSLVVVYDIPECSWIAEGDNLHLDILHIAAEDLTFPPCELIYPLSFSEEAVPDISEGLSQ